MELFLSILNVIIAIYSYKYKKLTFSGTISAMIIGFTTINSGYELYLVLLTFFITSTIATKIGSDFKKRILDNYKKEKTRNIWQVLSNGLYPTILILIHSILFNKPTSIENENNIYKNYIISSFICYYSCCNGDTWSSELGILSKSEPVMITNFKPVPKGTNGGVSLYGTLMSALGGLIIGLIYSVSNINECNIVNIFKMSLLGTFSGLFGSLIDSLLGSLFQLTIINKTDNTITSTINKDSIFLGRDILNNNQVNLISAVIVSNIFSIIYINFII